MKINPALVKGHQSQGRCQVDSILLSGTCREMVPTCIARSSSCLECLTKDSEKMSFHLMEEFSLDASRKKEALPIQYLSPL